MKSYKCRIIALLLALLLLIPAMRGLATEYVPGISNNTFPVIDYYKGQFTDVPNDAWYLMDIKAAFERGIISGTSSTTYAPDSELTYAQAIKMAAVIHSLYTFGSNTWETTTPWYKAYSDYALENKIITAEPSDYNAMISRSAFAQIFAKALPDVAFPYINFLASDYIPDVSVSDPYYADIFKLYRAGILTGSDSKGSLRPNTNIKRSEVAAVVARMIKPELRKSIYIPVSGNALSASEIAAKFSPAVFIVELYDYFGKKTGSGSGFFVDSSGIAVTNFHVIEDAYSAKITTTSGQKYNIAGVYDFLGENYGDIALIQIENTKGIEFPTLTIGDPSAAKQGDKVYAIGSPLGLENTVSDGLISNVANTQAYKYAAPYLQISVPISPGSSGGALLNDHGQVIGVTSATYTAGQNLNLATPITNLRGLRTDTVTPLSELFPPESTVKKEVVHEKDFVAYNDFPGIPDLAKMNDVKTPYVSNTAQKDEATGTTSRTVQFYNLTESSATALKEKFVATLERNSFEYDPDYDLTFSDKYVLQTYTCEWDGVEYAVRLIAMKGEGSSSWYVNAVLVMAEIESE